MTDEEKDLQEQAKAVLKQMYKVKVFESSYPEIVEEKVNNFLSTSKNKFIDAKYIKKYRHAHTLLRVLSAVESKQVTPSTVSDWILNNKYDFIKAWIDGYDVELEETDE